ncbi:hypothetical protein GLYMA_15G084532v4 [Glycine max]|nr:hypothetical protein GLYMA_15G084532v4 [Glycine max]KAH1146233.1 hypothetical protein GYH30_041749 [Glycine max]
MFAALTSLWIIFGLHCSCNTHSPVLVQRWLFTTSLCLRTREKRKSIKI